MIDLRYHVYSLAAIFFALAIGIVIGTSFVGKPADRKQMIEISQHYDAKIDEMKTELYKQQDMLRTARSNYSRSEKVCQTLVPFIIKDKLPYHNVAIIQTGDYDDLAANLRTIIQAAGGQVTSVTKISPSFDFEDTDAIKRVISTVGISPIRGESPRTTLIHTLAEAVTSARGIEKLPAMEEQKLVSVAGDYTCWNRFVVVVGGSSSDDARRAEIIDRPLLDDLIAQGANVVACEPLSANTSSIPVWKRMNIATIDNADKPAGQISLIYALIGETAHYGQKKTADRLIPESLEKKNG